MEKRKQDSSVSPEAPTVVKTMRVVGVVFGVWGLSNAITSAHGLFLIFNGGLAPQPLFNVALGFLAGFLYLNTARLLVWAKTEGLRWGFVSAGVAAISVLMYRGTAAEMLTAGSVAVALMWCANRLKL